MAYVLTENTHWMTSFWTGQLWLAYAVTGDDAFRREAERRLASFEHRLVNRIDESHDLGFLYTPQRAGAVADDGRSRPRASWASTRRSA